jgi:hypothetical protein
METSDYSHEEIAREGTPLIMIFPLPSRFYRITISDL